MYKAFGIAFIVALSAFTLAMTFSDDSESASANYTDVSTVDDLENEISSANAHIRIVENLTLDEDLVIPSGTTVLLPYSSEDTSGNGDGDTDSSRKLATEDKCFVKLTVNGKLTIDGTLIIGGLTACEHTYSYQGHTSDSHSRVINNGTIEVENTGKLLCYGFILGSGTVNVCSGASLTEPFTITEFVGGDNMYNLYDAHQAVFNRYALVNVQCTMVIDSGASLYTVFKMYAGGSILKPCTATFIGDTDAFLTLSNNATATFTYDPDKYIETSEGANIHKDIGKTTLTLNGGATYGGMKMALYGESIDLATAQFSFPYNIDITMENGNYLMGAKYRILPGSNMTVEEDAALIVKGELTVYYGLNDKAFRDSHYPYGTTLSSSGFSESGHLVLKGHMEVIGGASFRGVAELGGASAELTVDSKADVSSDTVSFGCDNKVNSIYVSKKTTSLTTREMAGSYVDAEGVLRTLETGKTYYPTAVETYTMSEYTQDTGTYSLNSTFKGGWSDVLLSTIDENITFTGGTLTYSLLPTILTGGTYTTVRVIATSTFTNEITVEDTFLQSLKDNGCSLLLIIGDYRIELPKSSIASLSGELKVCINEHSPTEAQNATAEKRMVFSVEIYMDSTLCDSAIISNITAPISKVSLMDVKKLQIWHITDEGKATGYKATYSNGEVSFTTAALGLFAISYTDVPVDTIHTLSMSHVYAAGSVLFCIMIALIAFLLYCRIENKKGA